MSKGLVNISKQKDKIDTTTNLNGYFMCDFCGIKFRRKFYLEKHVISNICRIRANVVCAWCKREFGNRGYLALHAYHVHGDSSYRNNVIVKTFKCDVCQSKFRRKWQMIRHIRSEHFNWSARTPCCEMKKINQVWFEKVLNSDKYIEIKKTGQNTLVMKGIDPNAFIKETDAKTEDLRPTNPIHRRELNTQCKFCFESFTTKRNLLQHMKYVHRKEVKYTCNNCHETFKSRRAFLKHECNELRDIKEVKLSDDSTLIDTS